MNSTENNPIACHSLNELVTSLSEGERTTYDNISRSISIPSDTFQSYCSWSKSSYTRNCIFDNEKFELILLCWEEGQMTPIHDHGGEECWVKIITDQFRERIYETSETGELNIVKSAVSNKGDITYMVDFMGFHSLENLSNSRSMSLHLYAKPIRHCNVFDQKSGQFVNKDLSYNTVSEIGLINK